MFTEYRPNRGYDEYFSAPDQPRSTLQPLLSSLGQLGLDELNRNHAAAGVLLRRLGATFRLNGSGSQGGERILPFDPLPTGNASKQACSNDWRLSTYFWPMSMAPSESSTTA